MSAKRPNDGATTQAQTPKRRKTTSSIKQHSDSALTPSRSISSEEKDKLREWLDKRDQDPKVKAIFTVKTLPVSKPKKKGRKKDEHVEHFSLGGKECGSISYAVSPATQWSRLQKYKRFTLPNDETFELKSCVLVKHGDSSDQFVDLDGHWKAQVLEIRALDETHVYCRVAWLENPRELAGGESIYHAKNELVASNEMAIIDAMSVSGGIEVVHWDDEDEDAPLPDPEKYFWRQSIDVLTGSLSQLRGICECGSPQNPDELMVRCNGCSHWLHAKCIIKKASEEAKENTVGAHQVNGAVERVKKADGRNGESKAKRIGRGKSKKGEAKRLKGEEDEESEDVEINLSAPEEGEKLKLVIGGGHTKAGSVREEDVRCLLCGEPVD